MTPKIRCSYYTDGDYIVTVNGRMVGQCLSKADAERKRDWLISAWNDLCDHFVESASVLVEHGYGSSVAVSIQKKLLGQKLNHNREDA